MSDALAELLGLFQAAAGRPLEVTGATLKAWPAASVKALQAVGVLTRAAPATGIVCPGCERGCPMTVERMPGAGREPLLFIVCDKLEDMAAVPVRAEALERWQVTEATLADALARLLGSSEATAWPGEALRLRLGMVEGRRRKDVAYLSWQTNGPMLMVAGHALELAQVLSIKAGRLVLDAGELRRCVDAPADGAEPPESPGERRRRFLEIVTKARKRNPRAFLQAAADSAGVSVDVLKQVIYRKPKPKPAGAIATVAGILSSPISPRARRTR